MYSNPTSNSPLIAQNLSSEDLSRLLLEVSELAIIMIDGTGIIKSWNRGAEEIYGFPADEVLGKSVQFLYSQGEGQFRATDYLNQTQKTGRLEHKEWQPKKDGSLFHASIIITPLWKENGELKGFSYTTRDITLQTRLERENKALQNHLEEKVRRRTRELEVVNKELEAFSYSVSHDLRAPLRAIIGFSKILIEDYESALDTDGKRYLNNIFKNADLMGQLIDDLLKFSKMSRLEVVADSVDMRQLVDMAIKEILPTPGENYSFEIKDIPPCRGDAGMLRQVWVNLIDNAIKYSSKTKNPRIEIGGRQEGNESLYYVIDNGVGFDMKYANKLFGVFQRLHSNDEFEGTGLGLALIQRIVHKHNGKITAAAEPGKGATFYFTIPD